MNGDNEQTDNQAIEETKAWLDKVVVGLNFCPFAKREVQQNSIRFSQCRSKKSKDVLTQFQSEVEHLECHPTTETTLLIIEGGFKGFYDYLDLVDMAQNWLEVHDYVGIYQIATFHPDYVFEDEAVDAAANYTNRSPYPTLHLLREESLARAISSYKNPEKIPENNINKAESMGVTALNTLLASCMKR